jgi:hypothetical protein
MDSYQPVRLYDAPMKMEAGYPSETPHATYLTSVLKIYVYEPARKHEAMLRMDAEVLFKTPLTSY